MKKEIYVYRVDATYSDNENDFMYSFYFMTPLPIETQFDRIINLICTEKRVSFEDLSSNYFDVNIVYAYTINKQINNHV